MEKLNSVLLIDDDKVSNEVTQALLALADITQHVEVAVNGREGLDILSQKCVSIASDPCPDLIMLDINMPVMNGFEFLEQFTQTHFASKPKVVMYTSSSAPGDLERARQFNVAGYLTKPFDAQQLRAILAGS
ncbi:Response regulator receiver domain-containing protein [Catalinimonas alkaloidigena]|uniref:Response regulator receiver domain-containing protein n=1 Tax=Catalinimonas alkaloidigena TaxID=1075417 RepID=A0A1G9T456_9BACT|nr:response regulator [Catalinimonas alkaloidigena]SDM42534.1 Response regulator receiver domain-containing protein [Catalinimonas alkaloidigena]